MHTGKYMMISTNLLQFNIYNISFLITSEVNKSVSGKSEEFRPVKVKQEIFHNLGMLIYLFMWYYLIIKTKLFVLTIISIVPSEYPDPNAKQNDTYNADASKKNSYIYNCFCYDIIH